MRAVQVEPLLVSLVSKAADLLSACDLDSETLAKLDIESIVHNPHNLLMDWLECSKEDTAAVTDGSTIKLVTTESSDSLTGLPFKINLMGSLGKKKPIVGLSDVLECADDYSDDISENIKQQGEKQRRPSFMVSRLYPNMHFSNSFSPFLHLGMVGEDLSHLEMPNSNNLTSQAWKQPPASLNNKNSHLLGQFSSLSALHHISHGSTNGSSKSREKKKRLSTQQVTDFYAQNVEAAATFDDRNSVDPPQGKKKRKLTSSSDLSASFDHDLAESTSEFCKADGCSKAGLASRNGFCVVHSCTRRCQFDGCTKCSQGSTNFCIAHGGGRRCTFPGCSKGARDKFFCAGHGGGKRCAVDVCTKSAVGGSSLCTSHGGGKRCQFEGCTKSSQGSTKFCVAHGGGRKCRMSGCTKVARGKTEFCASHFVATV